MALCTLRSSVLLSKGLKLSKVQVAFYYIPRNMPREYINPNYEDVEFPENRKLRPFDKVPQLLQGVKAWKSQKNLDDIRGPEPTHNELLYRQYGVVALHGGVLRHGHFEMIRNVINRKMDIARMFAYWRVDPPWKPVTRKGQGKRMGGGKGAIHHYVTPIKAGRIIFEMGGTVEYDLVRPLLLEVVGKLPFQAAAINQKMMEEAKAEKKRLEEENLNPYTYEYMIKNNMQGCHQWASKSDRSWYNRYV